MAANRLWVGGATAVAQVDTITLAGAAFTGDGTLRTQMTAEDGSTANVDTVCVAGTIETNRNNHLTNLQASTNVLFAAVSWTASGTASILGTARNAGVPFYGATTELVNDTAGSVSADSTTTANAGPEDFNTAANYAGGVVPVDTDTLYINEGTYNIRYGLDQNAVELAKIVIGPGYLGQIGDNAAGYYLQIDSTATVIESASPAIWIRGILPSVNVVRLPNSVNALRIGGDIDNLRLSGSGILGKTTVRASTVLDNLYITGCPAAVTELGTDITSFDLVEMDAGGHLTLKSGGSGLTINAAAGSTVVYHDDADEGLSALNNRGAAMEYNGTGNVATVVNYAGSLSFLKAASILVTVTTTTIYSGQLDAGANITFTNNIVRHGGVVNAATGNTINVAA